MYSVVISYVMQSFCRQKARRQKLHDFAIPTQTNEIDNVDSGRLCGRVSFRSFAGLDKNARFFEWLRFWDWQNQSCAAAPLHFLSYVRQSFRRLATAEFVVFVNAPCHWLCCWYLLTAVESCRLRTNPACTPHEKCKRVTRPCASVRFGRNIAP